MGIIAKIMVIIITFLIALTAFYIDYKQRKNKIKKIEKSFLAEKNNKKKSELDGLLKNLKEGIRFSKKVLIVMTFVCGIGILFGCYVTYDDYSNSLNQRTQISAQSQKIDSLKDSVNLAISLAHKQYINDTTIFGKLTRSANSKGFAIDSNFVLVGTTNYYGGSLIQNSGHIGSIKMSDIHINELKNKPSN